MELFIFIEYDSYEVKEYFGNRDWYSHFVSTCILCAPTIRVLHLLLRNL